MSHNFHSNSAPYVQEGGPKPDSYTPWLTRALALLIDYVPILLLFVITSVLGVAIISMFANLAVIAYVVWNYGYRQGTTGSSYGKSVMRFKVVGESTGQPIGFGPSFLRQLAHFIDAAIFCVGYLFPLWDVKRQTIADKLMRTVCVPE